MNRPVLAISGVVLIGALAVGCGDDRKCLDYDTQVVSTTTIINGKPVVGTSVVSVCVEYEEAKK